MRRARQGLALLTRRLDEPAIVAGRIKRLTSIRKKLKRSGISLWDIQDIAGIRAIVDTPGDVERIAGRYHDGGSRHLLAREDDYIATPKATGYRSRHLILRFVGRGDMAVFNKRSIEVQIRTRLQHSWATAIEAVGLMRGEDLKGGRGDEHWLRLFQLMAAQMADDEGLAPVPGQPPDRAERLKQIRVLEQYLGAVKILEGYRDAIKRVNQGRTSGGRFIVTFSRTEQRVYVAAVTSLEAFISASRRADNDGTESVVVEVDHVDRLIEAYPNYFGDVSLFLGKLHVYLSGRDGARKYALDWLRDWRYRKY